MKNFIQKLLCIIITIITFVSSSINAFAESDSKKAEFIHNHSEVLESLKECNKCWKKNGDVRIDFLEQIIHHNEIEVCMCENIMKYTDDKDVFGLAKKLIKASMDCNSELNELLDEIRKDPVKDKKNEEKYATEYDEKYNSMLLQLQIDRDDDNIDKIFLCSSKKHHECMASICGIINKYTNDEKINKLSKDISERMEKEIKKLNRTYKHVG